MGAIIALAGMLPALRLWWQIVFLAFAQFIIGPVVTLSSTTSHYVIPTLKTLSSGWEMTFGCSSTLFPSIRLWARKTAC